MSESHLTQVSEHKEPLSTPMKSLLSTSETPHVPTSTELLIKSLNQYSDNIIKQKKIIDDNIKNPLVKKNSKKRKDITTNLLEKEEEITNTTATKMVPFMSNEAYHKVISKFKLSSSQIEQAMIWLSTLLDEQIKEKEKNNNHILNSMLTKKEMIKNNKKKQNSFDNKKNLKLIVGNKKKKESIPKNNNNDDTDEDDEIDDKSKVKLVKNEEDEEVIMEKNGKRVKLSHRFHIREAKGEVENVRREAWEEGYPLLEEYDFNRDTRNRVLMAGDKQNDPKAVPYALRPDKRLRDYQEKALYSMFGAYNKARSGIVVLPCGAGKTLVGITAAQRIGRSTIVLCNNNAAAEQWRRSFIEFTDVPEKRLKIFHAGSKPEKLPDPCILITTYTILGDRRPVGGVEATGHQAMATKHVLDQICGSPNSPREWSLMILDEVHMSPARMFRTVMDKCKAQCKLGLTATLVREDDKIGELSYLIGPKLHEADWTELAAQNHLATVECFEVWCMMEGNHMRELLNRSDLPKSWEMGGQKLLSIMNPNKFRAAEFLLRKHEKLGDKVLIFSDNIHSLKTYCTLLDIPNLYGDSKHEEREALLGCFRGQPEHVFKNYVRRTRKLRGWGKHKWEDVVNGVDLTDDLNNILFKEFVALDAKTKQSYQFPALGLSSVGDVAIDLPDANVLIQVSGHGGGRRQEAQRMGRILRKKSEGLSNKACFYSLLCRDTKEMVLGAKRQEYLIDQGYQYKVLLAEDMLGDWKSTTIPIGSIAEKNLLDDALIKISDGGGGTDAFNDKKSSMTSSGGGGRGRKKNDKNSTDKIIVPTKYTQAGRYALMSWKKKAKKDRKPI